MLKNDVPRQWAGHTLENKYNNVLPQGALCYYVINLPLMKIHIRNQNN